MALKYWSTTDADNNLVTGTSINMSEGMAPSLYNDSWRAIMSDIRAWQFDPEYLDLGDEITYVSSTQFTVATDLTDIYSVGRGIRVTGLTTGTIYGEISASTYSSPNTTVTVDWLSGSMNDEELVAALHIINTLGYTSDIEAGTLMVFYQAAAPYGWTIDTGSEWSNDRGIIIDTSNGTDYGGTDDAVTCTKVPSHNHGVTTGTITTTTNGLHSHTNAVNYPGGSSHGGCCAYQMFTGISTGASGSHGHVWYLDIASQQPDSYEDYTPYYGKVIIASKDET